MKRGSIEIGPMMILAAVIATFVGALFGVAVLELISWATSL